MKRHIQSVLELMTTRKIIIKGSQDWGGLSRLGLLSSSCFCYLKKYVKTPNRHRHTWMIPIYPSKLEVTMQLLHHNDIHKKPRFFMTPRREQRRSPFFKGPLLLLFLTILLLKYYVHDYFWTFRIHKKNLREIERAFMFHF